MKRLFILFILYSISFNIYSQDECAIKELEIYAYPYSRYYTISPSIEEIKSYCGQYVKIRNYYDIDGSSLVSELANLEEQDSEPYITDEAEWTSKAIVTIHYSDSTKEAENLYIMIRGIVWRNRRYKHYEPLIESVYYFYPDRYLDGGY